jgi:hypothetical protein
MHTAFLTEVLHTCKTNVGQHYDSNRWIRLLHHRSSTILTLATSKLCLHSRRPQADVWSGRGRGGFNHPILATSALSESIAGCTYTPPTTIMLNLLHAIPMPLMHACGCRLANTTFRIQVHRPQINVSDHYLDVASQPSAIEWWFRCTARSESYVDIVSYSNTLPTTTETTTVVDNNTRSTITTLVNPAPSMNAKPGSRCSALSSTQFSTVDFVRRIDYISKRERCISWILPSFIRIQPALASSLVQPDVQHHVYLAVLLCARSRTCTSRQG